MTLTTFIIYIIVIGLIFYLVETYIPLSPPFQTMLRIIGVFIVIVLILALCGVNLPFRIS